MMHCSKNLPIMLNKFPYYDQVMLIKFSRAHIILYIMIILLKGKVILTDWLLELHHYHFVLYSFCKGIIFC